MRLLIANDDGIYSPGLLALAQTASKFGEVRVVAPDVEQSSMGHAITAWRPLSYRQTPIAGLDAWRVNGTPADCVALGVHLWENVDVVLSGINLGSNLGNGVWHSGTVAAAKQAALLGLRGIAFSTPVSTVEPDFDTLAPHVEQALAVLLPDTSLRLVNVNIPPEPKGVCWTRQAVNLYDGRVVPGEDPQGRTHYWFTVMRLDEAEAGTDRWAVERGYVSMTPLRLDLTNHDALAAAATQHALPASSSE
jgi:5'-nucleotidase